MAEYYDDWGTGSTDSGDMAANPSATTTTDLYPTQNTFRQGGGDTLFTYYTPEQYSNPQVDYSIGNYGTGDGGNTGGSGIASALGDIFETMIKPFNKENDPTQNRSAAAISIGGPAIFKMLAELMTGSEKKKAKREQQYVDAVTMNATTNANVLALKQKNLDASQISGTNFGAKPQGLLYQPANFVARQKRAGYQGA